MEVFSTILHLVLGFIAGVSATIVAIVVIEDENNFRRNKKEKQKR